MPEESTVPTLNDFIMSLYLGLAKVRHHQDLLLQLLTAHQKELQRRANGHPGSAELLHDLRIYRAIAVVVIRWLLTRLERKIESGKKGSRDSWRAVRYLFAAIDDLKLGVDQMSQHFPKRKLLDGVTERLQGLFTGVTAERAGYIATALEELVSGKPRDQRQSAA